MQRKGFILASREVRLELEEETEVAIMLAGLLPASCLDNFLLKSRPICKGWKHKRRLRPPTAVSNKRKGHRDMPTGQFDGFNASTGIPFSNMILVYVKLTIKTNEYLPASSLATGLEEGCFFLFSS